MSCKWIANDCQWVAIDCKIVVNHCKIEVTRFQHPYVSRLGLGLHAKIRPKKFPNFFWKAQQGLSDFILNLLLCSTSFRVSEGRTWTYSSSEDYIGTHCQIWSYLNTLHGRSTGTQSTQLIYQMLSFHDQHHVIQVQVHGEGEPDSDSSSRTSST
jgi:hypothetical protein